MQINKDPVLPPKTIGIIGGGQLGRMMALAARYMGYSIAVLDPTPNAPAAQVADRQIVAPYDDMDAVKQLTAVSDVITYEFENVDLHAAAYIENVGKLPQGAYALEITQNRQKEKELMRAKNLPVPEFAIVNSGAECAFVLEDFPLPAVIKTCRGGYDGKGQLKVETKADREKAVAFVEKNGVCILEQWISFDKEISVLFTRASSGEIAFFPIAENEHKDHILHKTIVPARIGETVKEKAVSAANVLAEKMNIIGTFAIEVFVKGDNIFLNEMAPRPHNSGHYTIEACTISQFAQHIRAICRLPLIKPELICPAVMINILGEDLDRVLQRMPKLENAFLHLYGKADVKAKRKMGHITFTGDKPEQLQQQLLLLEEAAH